MNSSKIHDDDADDHVVDILAISRRSVEELREEIVLQPRVSRMRIRILKRDIYRAGIPLFTLLSLQPYS